MPEAIPAFSNTAYSAACYPERQWLFDVRPLYHHLFGPLYRTQSDPLVDFIITNEHYYALINPLFLTLLKFSVFNLNFIFTLAFVNDNSNFIKIKRIYLPTHK